MKRLFFLSLAIVTITSASCKKLRLKGEGPVVSETRYVSPFNQINADGDVDVDVYPSSENKVEVSGYHNLVPVYKTEVSGNTLKLHFQDGYINVRNNNIHVSVYTTQPAGVKINGSGNINVSSGFQPGSMSADVNGSGKISIANNHFGNMDLRVNGSGEIDASSCTGDYVTAKISGSGNIKITVGNSLDAHISGSGDIDYWGNPGTVNTDISGSGKIRKH
ncbi:MAG: hypothetical protein BGO70_10210 [Bacteroidetes bacterium 43-93]|nr:DUF2807 domain-containing protein [Bacteroidota bacterium]OJX00529.1 MAG: hypothetical protein BGO70_10210 [Bacteroidetes bacterium 43-93]